MLLADEDVQPRVSLCKTVQRLVIDEGRADKHNVIKLAAEWDTELVHKELRLARVGRPNDESIERNVGGVHFSTAQILTVGSLR